MTTVYPSEDMLRATRHAPMLLHPRVAVILEAPWALDETRYHALLSGLPLSEDLFPTGAVIKPRLMLHYSRRRRFGRETRPRLRPVGYRAAPTAGYKQVLPRRPRGKSMSGQKRSLQPALARASLPRRPRGTSRSKAAADCGIEINDKGNREDPSPVCSP